MKNTFKIILAFAILGSLAFVTPKNSDPKKITVVIDAGHGGKDIKYNLKIQIRIS
jgi:N-acetylmuramoyl-L-alanine amidase